MSLLAKRLNVYEAIANFPKLCESEVVFYI